MKLLLTSAGIRNPSIHTALVSLLGKPIAECSALCIPTAVYAFPGGKNGAVFAQQFISGNGTETPMCELGWKSLGVLELTALPSLDKEVWVSVVQETDVLLVAGGDTLYLGYWMQQSGLADLLPSLSKTVYVGLSGGSVVMAPSLWKDFVHWQPPTGGEPTLGLVDFEMFPHLGHPSLPEHSMPHAEKWAAGLRVPGYAMDDETAIQVVDGTVEVVSEGQWKLFAPQHPAA